MKTRSQVEAGGYTLRADGIILSPGKFEGEPWYAVALWDCAMDGCADEDDGSRYGFRVDADLKRDIPDLACFLDGWVYLSESGDGFVSLDASEARMDPAHCLGD